MKKAAIYTLGCKTNQLESSVISDELTNLGWEIVDFNKHADVYIINSCTVTSRSDTNSRYYAKQAKKRNPDSVVILTGCYAQVSSDEISQIPEIDFIIGNKEKLNIPDLIDKVKNRVLVSDIMEEKEFTDKKVFSANGRTRVNIKIQDGCNFRCSYCIIPYARGKSRSNSIESIINQIKEVCEKGFKEIVITGIHLGQWGLDFTPRKNISDLLCKIEEIDALNRYRLGSIDPNEFSEEVLNLIFNSKKLCRHLHISLQSGSDDILKRMNRRYSVEFYSELINKIVKKMPDIAIGSDIIVGFPGETEENFLETYNNLKNLPISYIHVFPYSRRKGTPADKMPNQVPEIVKKERTFILNKLAQEKKKEFIQSQIGKELEVLVEFSREKKTNLLKGLSDNYIPILINNNDSFKNNLVKVKIESIDETGVKGFIV